jgi:hypothetical protein
MRSMFPGYSRPKSEEFAEKFKECIFCFDTNVLLNLYRFTPESRDNLVKVLQHAKIKDRIWLPHRVGLEYQRRRTDVLLGQLGLVGKAEGIIDVAIAELEKLRRTAMFAVELQGASRIPDFSGLAALQGAGRIPDLSGLAAALQGVGRIADFSGVAAAAMERATRIPYVGGLPGAAKEKSESEQNQPEEPPPPPAEDTQQE